MDYKNILPDIINWLLPLITSIITSIITYNTTKNITKNSRKLKINKKSFDNVYQPIYRYIKTFPNLKLTQDEELRFYNKLYILTEKNYTYTNPILIKLLKELKSLIDNKKYTNDKLYRIQYHVIKEYNKLRKYLDYPTANIIHSFNSLDSVGKTKTLLHLSFMSTCLGIYIYIFSYKKITLLATISIYWIAIFLLITAVIAIIGLYLQLVIFISIKTKRRQ